MGLARAGSRRPRVLEDPEVVVNESSLAERRVQNPLSPAGAVREGEGVESTRGVSWVPALPNDGDWFGVPRSLVWGAAKPCGVRTVREPSGVASRRRPEALRYVLVGYHKSLQQG